MVPLLGFTCIGEAFPGGFGWTPGWRITPPGFVLNTCLGNTGGLVAGLYPVPTGICPAVAVLNEGLATGGTCKEPEEKGAGTETLLAVCTADTA